MQFEWRDIDTDNPSAKEIKQWHEMSGLPLKKFFNTSGMIYREKNVKDLLPQMDEKQQYELLATDGMLVKRPLVVGKDFILVGFNEKQWEQQLLK